MIHFDIEYPSYYEAVKDNDIIFPLLELLQTPGFRMRQSDGKIEPINTQVVFDGPWHHIKPSYQHNCGLWHSILFGVLGRKMRGAPFVPSRCQMCFKVVVRPRTLEGLFTLQEMQRLMNYHAKCGVEPRPTVHGLYGGYFYNIGLQPGLKRWKEVWNAVDQDSVLKPALLPEQAKKRKTGTVVLLKRACTEMEAPPPEGCGDSDKWTVTPWQQHKEH